MRTSIEHLPEERQQEILEMVILFSSYAKNKQVNHKYVSDGITYKYISDYDFGSSEKVRGLTKK